MKKRILVSIVLTILMCMCIFSTTVNGVEITDFYTLINQSTNNPVDPSVYRPVIVTVDDTDFATKLNGHIFQKGDKIVFESKLRASESESSPDTIFEGFQIINGIAGPDITSTLATIDKESNFNSNIAQEITFTSEKPVILHSSAVGSLGEPVNNVTHRAFYIRCGIYEPDYLIEYRNTTEAVLQYGGTQIDKAYVTDDYYIIKFYDTYAKEGHHFNGIHIFNQLGQDFESMWLDPNTNPSTGGVTTLKTKVKKYRTDGEIPQGKMIVDISMTSGCYTLKLDGNGGKIDYIDSKIFEIENKYSDINLSDYNTPVREGYTFGGWYIDSACTKPAPETTSFDDEIYDERIAADVYNMTYYAKWIKKINNTYAITKSNTENGTFTVNKEGATKDEIVTITVTPNKGYKVKSVKVNNSEDGITASNTNYTFKMPEKNVTVAVEFELIETETSTKKTINKTEENVTVSATGTFTGNPVLTIGETKIGNEGYNSLITLVKDDQVVIGSYDISITGGTYEGELELTFTVGKQYEGDKVTIYHKKASEKIETLETIVKDGKATITVNELSPFMLVTDKETVVKKDETPKTGVNYFIGIATLIIIGSSIVGTIVMRKK